MQLDRVAVELRSRAPWEAVDLGTAMLRAWWRPLYGAWFVVLLPVALALHLLFAGDAFWAMLALWWLKPLFDRVLLSVLAPAVFGEPPGVKRMLAGLGATVRRSGLVGALTWRRFDSRRAFLLPVRQLEGQRGGAARARERLLSRRSGANATGVMMTCLAFETVALLSLVGLVDLLTPASLESEYGLSAFLRGLWDESPSASGQLANSLLYLCAMSIIEPLYVACGFALYLNRRTTLEAWDLELAFRRLAARHAEGAGRGRRAGVLSVALAAIGLWVGLAAVPAPAVAATDPQEAIGKVLASPDFGEVRKTTRWRMRQTESPETAPGRDASDWLIAVGRGMAELARVAGFLVIAVATVLLVRFLANNWPGRSGGGPKASPPKTVPATLFGLDVRPEALPDDLAGAARTVGTADPRAALSLLYRGALATLIHRDRVDLANGDTEGDCVREVRRAASAALGEYFGRLTDAWVETAYAGRAPAPDALDALCGEWSAHFSPRRTGAR